MKANYLLILAMPFLLFSCVQKEKQHDAPEVEIVDVDYRFSAVSETLSGAVDADFPSILWNEGDKISVLDGANNLLFVTRGSGSKVEIASESMLKSDIETIVSVFPYSSDAAISSSGTVSVKVPAFQEFTEGAKIAENTNVAFAGLAALDAEQVNILNFRNLCSFIKITVPEEENFTELSVYGEKSSILGGEVRVKLSEEGIPEVTYILDGTSTITATCENGFSGSFMIAVLPVTESDVYHVSAKNQSGDTIDDIAVTGNVALDRNTVVDFGTLRSPEQPLLMCTNCFWSNANLKWVYAGEAESFTLYVDGSKVAELGAEESTYNLTGLDCGTEYTVSVGVVSGGREVRSNEIKFSTGQIYQLKKNVSPTSVSVFFEDMSGGQAGNFVPCFYVQLFDNAEGSGTPVYEAYVLDSEKTSKGHPFFSSLVMGNDAPHTPTAVAFGALSPATDYWFRVKCVASYEYTEYQSSANETCMAKSYNGDSEYSKLMKLSTAESHVGSENEVLFQGFDDCSMEGDFINCAVGIMPAFKGGTESNATAYAKYPGMFSTWTNGWIFYGLRVDIKKANIYECGWMTQNTTAADYKFYSVDNVTGKPCIKPEFAAIPKDGDGVTQARIGNFQKSKMAGLADWITTNCGYPHEGYFAYGKYYDKLDKAPAAGTGAALMTPVLTKNLSLDASKTCILSFKALALQGRTGTVSIWHFDHDSAELKADNWVKKTEIKIHNSNGETENASTWSATADTHRWYEYTYEIDLGKNDALGFGFDGNACICIDDIMITVKQ